MIVSEWFGQRGRRLFGSFGLWVVFVDWNCVDYALELAELEFIAAM